ncbi:MAG TPA: prepilin-type N-terminal cleavage/methylation domain-containing protein [Ilumatobacter sp.]
MADAKSRREDEQRLTRAGRDRGFSVVEVIVTITLMAVVLVPIMSAVASSLKASSEGRSAAQVETALVNAADRVNRAPQKCNYLHYAQAAVQTQGWSEDRASVKHAYYMPGATPAASGTWAVGADGYEGCQISTTTVGLVQRVTITITSPDGTIKREIEVVKSRA